MRLSCLIIIAHVTCFTINRRVQIVHGTGEIDLMAGVAVGCDMSTCQRKLSELMATPKKRAILKTACRVACGTVEAELSLMNILVAIDTVRARYIESKCGMAARTGCIGVTLVERETEPSMVPFIIVSSR